MKEKFKIFWSIIKNILIVIIITSIYSHIFLDRYEVVIISILIIIYLNIMNFNSSWAMYQLKTTEIVKEDIKEIKEHIGITKKSDKIINKTLWGTGLFSPKDIQEIAEDIKERENEIKLKNKKLIENSLIISYINSIFQFIIYIIAIYHILIATSII